MKDAVPAARLDVSGSLPAAHRTRLDGDVVVVAVVAENGEAGGPGAGISGQTRVAVAVEIQVVETGDGHSFVDVPVAVVVDLIARLRRTRVDRDVEIVAVRTADGESVGVRVAAARVREPVSVEVAVAEGARVAVFVPMLAVTDLGVPREAVRIGIVAVVPAAFLGDVTVPVGVRSGGTSGDAAVEAFVASGGEAGEFPGRDALAPLVAVTARSDDGASLLTVAEQTVVAVGVIRALVRVIRPSNVCERIDEYEQESRHEEG